MNQLALHRPPRHRNANCSDLITIAERELAAFLRTVTELFGAEQARLSAEDWLRELMAINDLPASVREWRMFTVNASSRLASRANAQEKRNAARTLGAESGELFHESSPGMLSYEENDLSR
jgi:hypothetical protein